MAIFGLLNIWGIKELRLNLNNFRRILITSCLLIFSMLDGYVQFLSTGQDPYSIVWNQINTDNFQIIYPIEFYKEANRLANILEYSYEYTSKGFNNKPKKISVILHNNSVISNGVVSWAPKRIELITTPPQDSYAEDWLEQLALHEFRHVVQVDKLNQGITKILSWIMGQQGTGAVVGYLPLWFLEGDAVATETALSTTGRGRVPSFEMKLKALFTEKERKFSYDKLYLGSYKDFIPDYYELGYHMVAYSRLKYDQEIFSKTLDNVAKNPYQVSPFYFGLKKNYNLSKVKLFNETFDTLKYLWIKQINNINYTNNSNIISNKSKNYTSYRYPQYLNDSTLIVLKSGIDQVPQFVLIEKDGYEKKIHTPGFLSTDRISAKENKITWDEILSDHRWSHRNYSVVKILNFETGRIKQLTKKSRYFAPSVSHDGSKIAVVEIDVRNNCFLAILNSDNGTVENRIPSFQNAFLQLPEWVENNKVVVTSVDKKGNKIQVYDLRKKEWEDLLLPTYTNISQPVGWGNYILFRGAFNGIDNIYAVNRKSNEIFQITSSKYGAFDPIIKPGSNELTYTDYASNGYNVVKVKIDTNNWIPLFDVKNYSVKWHNQLAEQEGKNIQESDPPDKKYKTKEYSRILNTFNIHSWAPFYIDYSDLDYSDLPVSLGFTVLSQNKLSTAISDVGYSYENGYHYLYPRIIYSGFYPVIEFSAKFGGPAVFINWQNVTEPPDNMSFYKSYFIKSYLPLNFTNNKYIKQVRPQIEFEYDNACYYDGGYKRGLSFLHYKLNMYRYLKTSTRDIVPRWGQVMNFSYTHSYSNPFFGSMVSLSSRFYFPGLFPHHSLRLYGGIQEQYPKAVIYGIDRILLPRGFPTYFSKKLWKVSLDYTFPLLYPDLSLGPLAYIKRIKMNLFYDHAFGSDVREEPENGRNLNTGMYNSFGFELTSDFNILRFIFPFDSGIRYSYLPGKSDYSIEFLIYIDTSIL